RAALPAELAVGGVRRTAGRARGDETGAALLAELAPVLVDRAARRADLDHTGNLAVGVVGWFGADVVAVAGGVGPDELTRGGLRQVHRGVLLEAVLAPAQRAEVAGRGRTLRPGDGVVQVAAVRRAGAGRADAVPVAGAHVPGQHDPGPVAGRADVDDGAGGRVGEQAPPGRVDRDDAGEMGRDGAEPGQLRGRVGPAEQH